MPNVAVHMLEHLRPWGARRVYGHPGDGDRRRFQWIRKGRRRPVLHADRPKEVMAFMACEHAKFTGALGAIHPGDNE